MQEDRLHYLFHRAVGGSITAEERQELHALLADNSYRRQYNELFAQLPSLTATQEDVFRPQEADALFNKIKAATNMEAARKAVIPLTTWWACIAAGIALLLGFIGYRLFIHTPSAPVSLATALSPRKAGNVMLVLSDGRQIPLDSNQQHTVIRQQGAKAVSTDTGTLTYTAQPVPGEAAAIAYNTLTTPRGKHFKIVLPDGTRVWLNAASSLHYPTVFSEGQRKVTLSGEAYFEVAADSRKPFVVSTTGQTIRVLGTAFNVKAYTDESYTRTTLVEGRISITPENSNSPVLLSPGEQATWENNQLQIIKTDPQEATSWITGLFYFSDTELSVVLHQLQRWYDIDVDYASLPPGRLYGQLPRNTPLPQLLRAIEKTSNIKFKLNNDRLSVERQ
ncbi:DUF4974 domain-containing protein [Chitinophaga sp. Mgbs1]|uniref:DUF4974 domain-containing protein n=1 Tax=Chitinophaga solisilvae TaxID=1233460 RepID=A0A3S1D042_9BACT|nr:DUF4974 domain-containing protein [Chitinophaga solisilvae]